MSWQGRLETEYAAHLEKVKQDQRPVVAYTCLYTPPELIAAAGAVPVRIFSHDSQELADVGERYSRNYFCPFAQACIGELGKNISSRKHGKIDAFVVNYGCDQMRKVAEVAGHSFGIRTLAGFIPRLKNHRASLAIYLDELKTQKEFLEHLTGKKITDDELSLQITNYNRLRRLALQVDKARSSNGYHVPMSVILTLSEAASALPPELSIELYKTVLKRVETLEQKSQGPTQRIFLAGGPLCRKSKIIKLLDDVFGVSIAGDDLCTGSRAWENIVEEQASDPLQALATAYLHRAPCPRMKPEDDRNSKLRKAVISGNVKGVIYVSLKFCHCHGLAAGQVISELRKHCPVLHIETDYSDNDLGQLHTRIEAFLEIIRGVEHVAGE